VILPLPAEVPVQCLDLGTIEGLPRFLTWPVQRAYAPSRWRWRSQAFGCGSTTAALVRPSWYEKKAVVLLLKLLNLGVKRIVLGPTLPRLSLCVHGFPGHPYGIAR
jgi:hydroxylamine reductase